MITTAKKTVQRYKEVAKDLVYLIVLVVIVVPLSPHLPKLSTAVKEFAEQNATKMDQDVLQDVPVIQLPVNANVLNQNVETEQ